MSVTLSLFAGAGAQFFDNNGNVLSGGKIYTYAAGTTTPLATYTTNSESAFHTNPIILDAAGRVPSGGEIWLQLGVGYKFVLKTSTDVLIATYDNIPSSAQPPAANDADSIMYEQGYTVTAGSFVAGKIYRILTVGTTNFTLIGAVNNTVGTHFIATGVGTGTGTAELSQTVETKLAQTVSVVDFGAVGNGITDDYAAFRAALDALPATGGTLLIPATTANIWYLSDTLYLNKPVRIIGQTIAWSPFIASTGTILEFAADKFGLVVNSNDSVGAIAPGANYSNLSNLVIVSRGGQSGLNNGGTGIAVDGILIRAPKVRLDSVRVWYWKRNGIRIQTITAFVENANMWAINVADCQFNGSHGFFADGPNANAGVAIRLDCSNNSGWGIFDSSFLGNTYVGCHTDSNTLGPVKTDDPNASNTFIGLYSETGLAEIVDPTIIMGGLGSAEARVAPASTGFSFASGRAFNSPVKYVNGKGAVRIGGAVGQNDTSMSAFTFGANSESGGLDAWKLKFDSGNNAWTWQFANSPAFQPLSYINSLATAYTNKGLTGPVFQNGYAVTNTGVASVKVRLLGTAAPTTGTYEVGDIVYNSAPVAGGTIGFVCTTAGTPGTWKTFGAIAA